MPDNLTNLAYRNILVATGGAPHSLLAVQRAMQLAQHFGATLHVVTVVPQVAAPLMNVAATVSGGEAIEVQSLEDDRTRREAHLKATAVQARALGVPVVEHLIPALKPSEAILGVAQEVGADLIVLGRKHKSAWSAALAGSVADMVSHASTVDVLIAR